MALANILGGVEFDCTCNTANKKHHRGMVNSPTPCCLGQYHSSIASSANNRLLISTEFFYNLFVFHWGFHRFYMTCKSIVFFRLGICLPGIWCKFVHQFVQWCRMYPSHNLCTMLLLYFRWFRPGRIVGTALNPCLLPIGKNHWGTCCTLAQRSRRHMVDTKHFLWH